MFWNHTWYSSQWRVLCTNQFYNSCKAGHFSMPNAAEISAKESFNVYHFLCYVHMTKADRKETFTKLNLPVTCPKAGHFWSLPDDIFQANSSGQNTSKFTEKFFCFCCFHMTRLKMMRIQAEIYWPMVSVTFYSLIISKFVKAFICFCASHQHEKDICHFEIHISQNSQFWNQFWCSNISSCWIASINQITIHCWVTCSGLFKIHNKID